MWPVLAAVPAVVVAAAFSDTISLGVVLVGVMMVVGFAWASRKDKRAERWEGLYELADTERKEIQDKLDQAMELVKEQKEIITRLDAMQMPVRIVELMNASVEKIDEAARGRLEFALQQADASSARHEERAVERHEAAMELMGELVKAVTQLSIKVSHS